MVQINMKHILIIDMNSLTYEKVKTKAEYKMLGGRAFISKYLLNEIDPLCDPLGRNNVLIFTSGLLAGATLPCSGRLSIGSKSPLTEGIKESNAGGNMGTALTKMGYKAVVIKGKPMDKKAIYIIKIDAEGVKFIPAEELRMKGVYHTTEALYKKYGDKIQASIIGPAGEMKLRAAGIANTDKDGVPSRYAARGGLGAVMGSKGVKAIVCDTSDLKNIKIINMDLYKKVLKRYVNVIINNPAISIYAKYGTPAVIDLTNGIGCLPTRNFSEGRFEYAENINGKAMFENISKRKGEGSPTHGCMSGCVIRCSNIYPDKNGKTIVSPLEYETIGLLGSNLGIGNLDDIARLNYICNDYGLDTLDIGGALGVAMEEGLLEFGNADAAYRVIEEIPKNTILGRVIGNGVAVTGKVLGAKHVPQVLGQGMPAYEPRGIKGLGVTFMTAAMGADHTVGPTHKMPVDHYKAEGQIEASKNSQISCAIYDCLGLCLFVSSGIGAEKQILVELINAIYGVNWALEDLTNMAKNTIKQEIDFNQRAGLKRINRLPEYMYYEKNKTTGTYFDVPESEILKNWF